MLIKIVPDEQVGEIIRSAGSQAALHILQPCIMNRAREGKATSSSAESASSLLKELGGIRFTVQTLWDRWRAPTTVFDQNLLFMFCFNFSSV